MENNEQNTVNIAGENTANELENKEQSIAVNADETQQKMSQADIDREMRRMQYQVKNAIAAQGGKEIVIGLLLIIVGAIFTFTSTTKIYIGAFIVGGIYIVKGIYHLIKAARIKIR